jgi:hypothetical protein
MRTANRWTVRLLSCALIVALCGIPEAVQAQSAAQVQRHNIAGEEPPLQDQRTPPDPVVRDQVTVPEAAALPDAPSSARLMAQAQATPAPPANSAPASEPAASPQDQTAPQQDQTATPQGTSAATTPTTNQNGQAPATQNKPAEEPAGAAAAQAGVTSGGAASKPAGMAIAPAKQRQVRSLLIKLGAIAAGGAAIGAVVALSKGSPSKPPGAK